MRPDALRPATKAAAKASSSKLATRLSKGEKRNRKRMATVGAVYDLTPVPRTATDVLTTSDTPTPAPKASNKWLTASVAQDTTAVLAAVFDQAQRRDPTHSRTWVALVDGNNHQIDRIHAEAKDRGVTVTVLLDFVHVLEYLWRAAWSFYPEGDPNAETWVHDKALRILNGKASTVAAAIRRKATRRDLPAARRVSADKCADYLLHKRGYLDYPKALANGWPIATGIIEGACRHIVKDRMDITGARWGLNGAEAILSYEPCTPTATSTTTGHITSHKNDAESTSPATPTRSFHAPPDGHSRRAAPNSKSPPTRGRQRTSASASWPVPWVVVSRRWQ